MDNQLTKENQMCLCDTFQGTNINCPLHGTEPYESHRTSKEMTEIAGELERCEEEARAGNNIYCAAVRFSLLRSAITELRTMAKEIERLTRERDHWKRMHDGCLELYRQARSSDETSGEPEPVAFVGYVNEHPDIIYPGTTRLEGRRYLPIWRPEDHPCARRDAPSEIRVGDTVTMERYRQRGEHEGWIVTWIRDTPDGKFYDVRHPRGGATSASADEIRLSQKAKPDSTGE